MPQNGLQHDHLELSPFCANGLDQDDCSALSNAVAELVPDWSVETHTDPYGEDSFVIMPPEADDALGPLLIVRRLAWRYHLDQFRWDNYTTVGDYSDLGDVLIAIHRTLHNLIAFH